MAFHILKSKTEDALRLSKAISDVKTSVRNCAICYTLTNEDPCPICSDPRRDATQVLVVEQPKDLISLEQTGMFRGVYHVLLGRIDPLAGVQPDDLTIPDLMRRLREPAANCRGEAVAEVILGLNPNLEGDSTALYLADVVAKAGVRVSRLARGLPAGSQLEYASRAVLADAIHGRQSMGGSETSRDPS